MKLIIKLIGLAIVAGIVTFLGAGLFSSQDFEGSVNTTLVSPPEDIWPLISKPKERESRLGITSISRLDQNALGFASWTENGQKDEWARYEILEENEPKKLTIAMMSSSHKLTGLWTYTLSSNDGIHTILTIHETSRLNNFMDRSLNTLKGRNSHLRAELRSITRTLRQEPSTQNNNDATTAN